MQWLGLPSTAGLEICLDAFLWLACKWSGLREHPQRTGLQDITLKGQTYRTLPELIPAVLVYLQNMLSDKVAASLALPDVINALAVPAVGTACQRACCIS